MADFINPKNAKLMMIIAMSIFGTIGTITHFIDMPSSIIVLFRGVVGTIFILVIIRLMGSHIEKDDVFSNMFVLICSGICLGLNWLFLFEAYKNLDVSLATVCNYTTPAMVILVSPIFLKEKLTLTKLGCALLALFGLILASGVIQNSSLGTNSYGITCGILGAVFYTGLIIFNKKLRSINSFDKTVVQLAIATVVILIYSLFTVDYGTLNFTTDAVILMVILGIIQTGLAFTLYFGSLTYLDTQNAVIFGYLEPIVGLMLSVIVLGEDLGIIGWIGAILILGSTMVPEVIGKVRMKKSAEPD